MIFFFFSNLLFALRALEKKKNVALPNKTSHINIFHEILIFTHL